MSEILTRVTKIRFTARTFDNTRRYVKCCYVYMYSLCMVL